MHIGASQAGNKRVAGQAAKIEAADVRLMVIGVLVLS